MKLNKDGFEMDNDDWWFIAVIVLIICLFTKC